MTVIETGKGTSLRREYRELRRELGAPRERFEDEWRLAKRVKPRSVTLVAETKRRLVADEEIAHLRDRGQSFTWDVPERLHQTIIKRLVSRYGGKTYSFRRTYELVVWSAPQLRRAALNL